MDKETYIDESPEHLPNGEEKQGIRDKVFNRRRLLGGLSTLSAVVLAGCSGDDGDDGDDSDDSPNVDELTEVHSLNLDGPSPDDGVDHQTAKIAYEAIVEELPFPWEVRIQKHSRNVELSFFNHDYDATYSKFTLRPERVDPHNLLVGNLRQANHECGGFNITGYKDEAFEELADEEMGIVEPEERQPVIHEIQEKLATLEGDVEFSTQRSLGFPVYPQVWNSNKFTNVSETAGIGIRNIWTFNEIEPLTDDRELVVVLSTESSNINPLISDAGNRSAVQNVFDNLTRMGRDGLPRPWLATDWTSSDNNTEFEFDIRTGHEFHDGEPLTVDDITFSYEYLREHSPFLGGALERITDVEAVDDSTVRFGLDEPFAPVFTSVFNRVPIIPKHVWEDVPDNVDAEEAFQWSPTENDKFFGSGHMQFVQRKKGAEIKLEKNPDHWRPANLDGIVFNIVQNTQAILSGLENSQLDLLWQLSGADIETLVSVVDENDHLSQKSVEGVGSRSNLMNSLVGPFSFPEVRAAIECVIPKKTIVNEVWNGFCNEGQGGYSAGVEFWYNDDQKNWGASYQGREKAIEILEDRGFVIENDTIYYPEGEAPPERLEGYGCE